MSLRCWYNPQTNQVIPLGSNGSHYSHLQAIADYDDLTTPSLLIDGEECEDAWAIAEATSDAIDQNDAVVLAGEWVRVNVDPQVTTLPYIHAMSLDMARQTMGFLRRHGFTPDATLTISVFTLNCPSAMVSVADYTTDGRSFFERARRDVALGITITELEHELDESDLPSP